MALNREQFFLLKLAEECSEVAKRAIKQMQFGKDEAQNASVKLNPNDTEPRPTNAQRLREEINDLLVLVRMLEILEEIPEVIVEEKSSIYVAKYVKLAKYLKYSQLLDKVETFYDSEGIPGASRYV